MTRINLVLVDDNAIFRDGVARPLNADGCFRVVGQATTGVEAVTVVEELSPASDASYAAIARDLRSVPRPCATASATPIRSSRSTTAPRP